MPKIVTFFSLVLVPAVVSAAPLGALDTTQTVLPPAKPVFGIRVNPIFLAVGAAQVDAEVAVLPRLGLGLSGFFLVDGKARLDGKVLKMSFNHLGLRATYMLTGHALGSGFFLAPSIGAVFGGSTDLRDGVTAIAAMNGLTLGTAVGYQYVSGPGLSFRAGVGARYFNVASQVEGRRGDAVVRMAGPTQNVLTPEIDLAVGWVF